MRHKAAPVGAAFFLVFIRHDGGMDDQIRLAAEWLHQADALVVLAGAGMGIDSGLPSFRGAEGLWRAYPPLRELGVDFFAMANPRCFVDNPHLAWGFYSHRLALYRATEPHAGFSMLHDWFQTRSYFAVTSNVDGHFQRSGFHGVWEVHGSIHHLQCSVPCSADIWSADDIHLDIDEKTLLASDPLPRCPHCGAVARPNILLFHDANWIHQRTADQQDIAEAWLQAQYGKKVVCLEIGAGTAVPTIRSIGNDWSRHLPDHVHYVRVNPEEPLPTPPGGVSIAAPALHALREINNCMLGWR